MDDKQNKSQNSKNQKNMVEIIEIQSDESVQEIGNKSLQPAVQQASYLPSYNMNEFDQFQIPQQLLYQQYYNQLVQQCQQQPQLPYTDMMQIPQPQIFYPFQNMFQNQQLNGQYNMINLFQNMDQLNVPQQIQPIVQQPFQEQEQSQEKQEIVKCLKCDIQLQKIKNNIQECIKCQKQKITQKNQKKIQKTSQNSKQQVFQQEVIFEKPKLNEFERVDLIQERLDIANYLTSFTDIQINNFPELPELDILLRKIVPHLLQTIFLREEDQLDFPFLLFTTFFEDLNIIEDFIIYSIKELAKEISQFFEFNNQQVDLTFITSIIQQIEQTQYLREKFYQPFQNLPNELTNQIQYLQLNQKKNQENLKRLQNNEENKEQIEKLKQEQSII